MMYSRWVSVALRQRVPIILVVLFLSASLLSKEFLSLGNLVNVLFQISSDGIIAIGMTFVIITGGIDLSVGAIVSLTTVIVIGSQAHFGTWAGIGLALATGVIIGFANGILVGRVGVNPFISTLGVLTFARGLAQTLSNSKTISGIDPAFSGVIETRLLGIPLATVIFLSLLAVSHFFLSGTSAGRGFYAVGGNKEASWLAGVRVNAYLPAAYAFASFTAALSGVIVASRINTGSPIIGNDTAIVVIAAVLIGGTSMSGGSGSLLGTLQGILVLGVLRNGLNLLGMGGYSQIIIIGGLLILVMLIERYSSAARWVRRRRLPLL